MPDNTFLGNEELRSIEQVFEDTEKDNEGLDKVVAGFLVGYVIKWMALQLIFEPREPVKVRTFTIQGFFIKRQMEAARAFARVIADKV